MDMVAYDDESKRLLVAECKWRNLDSAEAKRLLERLRPAFSRTRLAKKYPKVEYRVFSKKDLGTIAGRES
ncbi:MAG: hypothetical protein HY922_02535 [Elusimicrobia bacterium]|nr:hypothetical protein [Elusimicrobiota bacterium]